MLLVSSSKYLCWFWLWLAALVFAQRDCEKDGDTSTYNQNSLVVSFENLCGKDIEASLDYFSSSEPRRSDCIDRCVKQAPLCYGFDYTPYTSNSQHNCYLMNGTFDASNATYRNFVADAGMLDPNLAVNIPRSCQTLSLRECLEKNAELVPSASSMSASSWSPTTKPTASTTSGPTASSNNSGQTIGGTRGLSTGAKAGIGAGSGLVALIAILVGVLLLLKRVKRKRGAANSQILATETGQKSHGDSHPRYKAESQTYAHMETSPVRPASSVEQIHEIDGRPRHEK